MDLHRENGGYIGADGRVAKAVSDPYASSVTLLLAPEAADTTITNKLGTTTVVNNSVQLASTMTPWGTAGKVMDFSTNRWIDINLRCEHLDGATDYTIEAYFYSRSSTFGSIIGKYTMGSVWGIGTDTSLNFYFPGQPYAQNTSHSLNTWTYACAVRQGNQVTLYKNDAVVTSLTAPSGTYYTDRIDIGRTHESNWYFNGQIAALRITKAARTPDTFMYSASPLAESTKLSGVWSV